MLQLYGGDTTAGCRTASRIVTFRMFFLPLLLLQNLKGLASGNELKSSGQNICKFPIYRIRKDPGHYSEISWSVRKK